VPSFSIATLFSSLIDFSWSFVFVNCNCFDFEGAVSLSVNKINICMEACCIIRTVAWGIAESQLISSTNMLKYARASARVRYSETSWVRCPANLQRRNAGLRMNDRIHLLFYVVIFTHCLMKARFDQLFAESCCKKECSVLNNSIVCTHLLKSNEGKL